MKRLLLASVMLTSVFCLSAHAQTGNYPTWTNDNGFYVSGNPKAKVRVKVFLSMSCPHCRSFFLDTVDPLRKQYVQGGEVSFEIIENASPPGDGLYGFVYAHCLGGPRYFDTLTALYNHQEHLYSEGPYKWISETAAASGVPEAKVKACLGNQAAINAEMERYYTSSIIMSDRNIHYLPSVVINGQEVDYPQTADAIEWFLERQHASPQKEKAPSDAVGGAAPDGTLPEK